MAYYYLLFLLIALIIFHGYFTIRIVLFYQTSPRIPDLDINEAMDFPKVSILVPIHNEARYLKEAMTRLLGLDYPNYEIIAINDRSTDGCGEILKNCQEDTPRLNVIDVDALPEGWLGKTHALQKGLERASGEYILLTDADVLFHKRLLKHALYYTVTNKLDHLTLGPFCITQSFAVRAVILFQILGLYFLFKPWTIKNNNSKNAIGIGAFNLFKKSSLDKIGGLNNVAMNPIDDIGLGRLLKAGGFKQDFILALDWLKVEWYDAVKSLFFGLEKNSFAAFEYQILPVVLSQCFSLLATFFPLYMAFLFKGVLSVLALLDISLVLVMLGILAYYMPINIFYALTYPVTSVISMMICVGNVGKTLFRGGINWGGQFFSLKALKAFRKETLSLFEKTQK